MIDQKWLRVIKHDLLPIKPLSFLSVFLSFCLSDLKLWKLWNFCFRWRSFLYKLYINTYNCKWCPELLKLSLPIIKWKLCKQCSLPKLPLSLDITLNNFTDPKWSSLRSRAWKIRHISLRYLLLRPISSITRLGVSYQYFYLQITQNWFTDCPIRVNNHY